MKSSSVACYVNGSHVCVIDDIDFDHTCNISMTLNALSCADKLLGSYSCIHTTTTVLLLLLYSTIHLLLY